MSRTKKALIAGGGIAGPVTAMALQRAGMESVVYEAYTGGAEDAGAFLTFASNGLDALRTIDAHHLVLEKGFPTPRMEIQSGTGKHLGVVPNGGTLPDGTVSHTLKRSDLYRTLRDEAVRRGARVEYGRRLVDAEAQPDGVVARFEDGTEAEGDLLIGADGIHSRTRRIIDPSAPQARYIPVLNTGGYTSGVRVQAEPDTFHMVFGKRAFFGYAVHPSGEIWWFANPPRPDEPTRAELAAISTEQWREMLVDLFAEDNSPAVRIIRATQGRLAGWATYDLPSVPTWYRGPMIVIGDAAHATSPSSGQGASMAIEDGVVLARCLRDLPDVPQAGRTHRRARGEDEQQQSRRSYCPEDTRPDNAHDPEARVRRRVPRLDARLPHRLGREGGLRKHGDGAIHADRASRSTSGPSVSCVIREWFMKAAAEAPEAAAIMAP
jgi:FAD-dependent urate hydroxylase